MIIPCVYFCLFSDCSFIGNCVGINNYQSFYMFILSTCIVALMFSYLNLAYLYHDSTSSFYPFPLLFSLFHLYPLTLFILLVTIQQLFHTIRGFTLNESVNVRKSRYSNYLQRIKTNELYHFPLLDSIPSIAGTYCYRFPCVWKFISLFIAIIKNLVFFIVFSPSFKRKANRKFDGEDEIMGINKENNEKKEGDIEQANNQNAGN